MKIRIYLLSALMAFGVISTAQAVNLAAAKQKAMFVCSECHGLQGISVVENFPNLAGQKELYLANQLKAFKSGVRKSQEMNLIAKQLSSADIANLAAYFARLPRDPKLEYR